MSAAVKTAKPASVTDLRSAVLNLEHPLHDARTMAKIVSTLIEDRLPGADQYGMSHIGDLGEAITWAVNHLEALVNKAHADWNEVRKMSFEVETVARTAEGSHD